MTKHNGRAARKTIAAVFTMSMIGLLSTGTASASHTHSMQTGNGSCVLLAQNGQEKDVELPFVTDGQAHPIHVLVHKGKPGEGGRIGVEGLEGSDPRYDGGVPIDYLND